MTGPSPGNLAQSVKQRLLNLSRERGEVFNIVLARFAVERLLYRLTRSAHADHFILKGAMLFAAWADKPHRPTQDLDLLGFGTPSAERLAGVFRELCGVTVEPDGVSFDPGSVAVASIREEAVYDGLRVTLKATLGSARIPLQVDVGFGDAVTPAPRDLVFGPMLDMPAPRLRAYPPETVVAEKLDAIITLGMTNSRMKDYFDLWTLARTMAFRLEDLRAAARATAERRRTEWTEAVPVGLTDEFGADPVKSTQWNGFLRKTGLAAATPGLAPVVVVVREFLAPVVAPNAPRTGSWQPGGPWA